MCHRVSPDILYNVEQVPPSQRNTTDNFFKSVVWRLKLCKGERTKRLIMLLIHKYIDSYFVMFSFIRSCKQWWRLQDLLAVLKGQTRTHRRLMADWLQNDLGAAADQTFSLTAKKVRKADTRVNGKRCSISPGEMVPIKKEERESSRRRDVLSLKDIYQVSRKLVEKQSGTPAHVYFKSWQLLL